MILAQRLAIAASIGIITPVALADFNQSTSFVSRIESLEAKVLTLESKLAPTARLTSRPEVPIVLIAKLTIKPEKITDFLDCISSLNKREQLTLPGTIIHTINPDPNDPNTFTVNEVYQHDAAWNTHLDAQEERHDPVMAAGYARFSEFLAEDGVKLDYYGEVTPATKARFEEKGIPINWHTPVLGFAAKLAPRSSDTRIE
jgi:quinol monooxygenase YgiN